MYMGICNHLHMSLYGAYGYMQPPVYAHMQHDMDDMEHMHFYMCFYMYMHFIWVYVHMVQSYPFVVV